ncbi:MAG: ARMT1-like domain-containing protein [Nitrospiraceae bacterium]|nr:ARMT1-like domain-containing protein [Nitrospiraceae bacterium]
MKVHPDCFPCFFRQAVIALRLSRAEERFEAVMKGIMPELLKADFSKSPAHATTFMHRRIREILATDPFKKVKSDYNRLAMEACVRFSEAVSSSDDPLFTASRLAIAGNIIDFGIFTSVDIGATVERALDGPIACDNYAAFRKEIEKAGGILYLLDNAGEIAFDRTLIELLVKMGKDVTAVVKGCPVLNDATMEDARETGLTDICRVVDNGSDCIGTILDMTSPGFRNIYEKAGLVISKGQGNFETLMDEGKRKNIFFLFQSKCEVVSRELALPLKSMLLKRL